MQQPNSEYTVLARRFRPQTFDEVVGQGMVAQALRNAIANSRVAHAYLFTGARGVGKTSMARILAKSLNCPQKQGPDPCNECEICLGISAGSDVDVLEIDGASNRGIEDIRSLRANVNVKSMRTHYKVYIIDEVHMLTREAFNALLKTLEEPPPTVKFIFCTTEPNKLPDTILSRCQRFDFGTIDLPNIGERLKQIAAAEGIAVEDEAINLVARRAAGSMRDSQSLFDQLLAFGGDPITPADVHRLFGTAGDSRLVEIFEAVIAGEKAQVLQLLDVALEEGVQLGEMTSQLLDYLRDMMVLAAGADRVRLSAVSPEFTSQIKEQAGRWGLETIVAAIEILAEAKGKMQRVTYGRALAELALIRLTLLAHVHDLADLIEQIKAGSLPSTPSAPPPAQPTARLQPVAAPVQSVPTPVQPITTPVVEEPQKKNEISDTPEPQPAILATSATPVVEFQAGAEEAVWTEVLSRVPDMLKSNLQRSVNIAISGPNALEISFPKSYHLNQEYCQRREQLTRLENALEEVAGRRITIAMKLTSDPLPAPGQSSAAGGSQQADVTRRIDPEDDPLVKQALTVFNATVVKVEERWSSSLISEELNPMLKGLGNLASIMKQAQQMQGRMSEMQDNLGKIRVEGTAGGGMVTIEATGQQQVVGCKVEQSLIDDGDREMLEDLVVAATNSALKKAKEAAAEEMSSIAGGMNIPGLGDALSQLGLGGTEPPAGS